MLKRVVSLTRRHLAAWNEAPRPFVWKATADSILEKAKRCKELNVTRHN